MEGFYLLIFSFAFKKMQPHILIDHLASYFKLPDQLLVLFFLIFLQTESSRYWWMDVCPGSGSQTQAHHTTSTIHNEEVQIVDSYKYLGTLFDSQLISKENTESWLSNGVNMESTLR